jgi:hypothetical protein
VQVLSGSARKRPGGAGTKKRCGWCGELGHRTTAQSPCKNPQKEVSVAAERAKLKNAQEEAQARAAKKKEAKAQSATQAEEKRRAAATTPQGNAEPPPASKTSEEKATAAGTSTGPKLTLESAATAATPAPKPSPRPPPRDRSDAKRAQAEATLLKSPAARENEFETDAGALDDVTSPPDFTQELEKSGEEQASHSARRSQRKGREGDSSENAPSSSKQSASETRGTEQAKVKEEKVKEETPRRSQRGKGGEGDEDDNFVLSSRLRPGPAGSRLSIETGDKRILLWNAGMCV